jgi:hypothetical protein
MSKMLKTSADNRKCMYPNCRQTLSIYNHDNYCHVHRNEMPEEHREYKPKLSIHQQANA